MMIDRVFETIKKYNLISCGETVIVGVSGGPDSVCLLHILHLLSNKLNFTIHAVHINHLLRGGESENDEKYVCGLCKTLGIPLFSESINIKAISEERGISLEEAGRETRYDRFESVLTSIGANKIAVAHNKNDQAETVLMNIMRGTGLDGLKGMDYKRGKIIRPLLDVERKDIEEYCIEHLLNPRIDSSNLKSIYTRNKVRIELIPHINRLFAINAVDNICKMSNLLKDDCDFIDNSASALYGRCVSNREKNEVWMNIPQINNIHTALRKRVVRFAIKEVKGDLNGIENVHIEDIVHLAVNGRTGAKICLPGGIRAGRSYDTLKIYLESVEKSTVGFYKTVDIPGTTVVEYPGFTIEASIGDAPEDIEKYCNMPDDSPEQFFDYEQLAGGISVRNRFDGDIFKPKKSTGTKKLKKYMIDNKIPREIRDEIPLIALENEIVWIIGYKTGDKFKVTGNTKKILRLEFCRRQPCKE